MGRGNETQHSPYTDIYAFPKDRTFESRDTIQNDIPSSELCHATKQLENFNELCQDYQVL